MGFLNACVDMLLKLATLTPFNPFDEFAAQQPLFSSDITAQHPLQPSPGVDFHPVDASPGFQCHYPPNWVSCNTPTSRDCWIRDSNSAHGKFSQKDIHTDYENPAAVPDGITREYWLEVDGDVPLYADGFNKTSGKVFNGTFPGPLIEACWGDELVIHVKNNYEKNGTTVHWHGITQLNTNQMDGVNGVTQCPIAQGDTFTYKFKALQYGHTWYHSHYALQYPDGLAGPLIIHGPASAPWDVDLGPVLVQDYVHDSAFVVYQQEITPGTFAKADSIVVNGHGHDPVTTKGSYFETTFTPKKKHLLRLINGSAGTMYVFSIDNHTMTVIANDLVAIKPYKAESILIGIGQRYTVVVEADQAAGDYWVRTHPATGCNGFNPPTLPCNGSFTDNCEPFPVTTGVIRYNTSSGTGNELPSDATSVAWNYSRTCQDEPASSLHPIVPWYIDHHPQNNISESRFAAAHQTVDSSNATGSYEHWMLTPDFLWLDFSNPTILDLDGEDWNPNFHIIEDNYDSGFVFMIIEADSALSLPPNTNVPPVNHPIHWHGMDVVVLAQSNTSFNATTSYDHFNFDNPPRRDVVLLPANGYIAIAFKPNNPGVWLVHCHIAWHASAGLGLQILERQGEIVGALGGPSALADTRRVCENWREFNETHPGLIHQDDSGI